MGASDNVEGNGSTLTKKESEKVATKKVNVNNKQNTKPSIKNQVTGLKDFLNGVKAELKKVHWPTRKETVIYTGVVVLTVVVIAATLWVFDSVLSKALSLIIG